MNRIHSYLDLETKIMKLVTESSEDLFFLYYYFFLREHLVLRTKIMKSKIDSK